MGCRRRAASSALFRLAVDDGQLVAGAGRPGRGAWLCRAQLLACFDRASEARQWPRVLRSGIDPDSVRNLRAELSESLYGAPGRSGPCRR